MTDNYLLCGESARKLYFDCARALPPICVCPVGAEREGRFSNAAEAFLLSDERKLAFMRECGVDEKYVGGDASDFEKLREFCRVLPKCVGNPIYLLSHAELRTVWSCDISVNEHNCDAIWCTLNDRLRALGGERRGITESAGAHVFRYPDTDCVMGGKIDSHEALEKYVSAKFDRAEKSGRAVGVLRADGRFLSPNPYAAGKILGRLALGEDISEEERLLLDMQIKRTVGAECARRDLPLLFLGGAENLRTSEYLDKAHALPRRLNALALDVTLGERVISEQIADFARTGALGNSAIFPICSGNLSDIADCDYLKRIVCSFLGRAFDKGEYFENYESLCRLAEDVLYNNLNGLVRRTKI